MFVLWVFSIVFTTTAFNITPSVPNAIQYIKTIFLTSNGSNTSSTGIILDGSGGTAWFSGDVTLNSLPNAVVLGTDGSGKIIYSTSGDVYNFISWFALNGPRGATWADGSPWLQGAQWNTWADGFLPTGALWATPFWNGTSRTITDQNIFNLWNNVGIGTLVAGAKLQVNGDFIAGSSENSIQNPLWYSSILGGEKQRIVNARASTIAGWFENIISDSTYSFIWWGYHNTMIRTRYSSIVWGSWNTIEWEKVEYSTIAGWLWNTLDTSSYSFIWWGAGNSFWGKQWSKCSSIVGWYKNTIVNTADYSTIVGWVSNIIDNSIYSFVWWWAGNIVRWSHSSIVWGSWNTFWDKNPSDYSFIWWWEGNSMRWSHSTILGWYKNSINYSNYSVVAWYQAMAKHNNVFVRNSDTGVTFESKKAWDFLINVPGSSGVGINTNYPEFALDVNGDIRSNHNIITNTIESASYSVSWQPWKTDNITVKGSDGFDCVLNFAWGILIGDTCP